MTTAYFNHRRSKRLYSSLSCPSASSSDDDGKIPPHKKLAQSLNRLSLSSTPVPESRPDVEMRSRRSYEKDAFTTVIESLSTTSSDGEHEDHSIDKILDAPFPREEARVTILSEIEKRLSQFPPKLFSMNSSPYNALVLYRSPESMGLPNLERRRQEDAKASIRKRIAERRRMEVRNHADGYEADAEDLGDTSPIVSTRSTGVENHIADNSVQEEEYSEDTMDLD
jgi:hypothetical protein